MERLLTSTLGAQPAEDRHVDDYGNPVDDPLLRSDQPDREDER